MACKLNDVFCVITGLDCNSIVRISDAFCCYAINLIIIYYFLIWLVTETRSQIQPDDLAIIALGVKIKPL